MLPDVAVAVSGARFRVVYRLTGSAAQAHAMAQDICLEQTVEIPASLVPPGGIAGQVVGRVESLVALEPALHEAVISYAVENVGAELSQLLNTVFGNYSLQQGARVERLELPDALLAALGGPRYGQAGLRELLAVERRPLLATALKPLGLPVVALAELAYQMALGGIDIIKDDHGLSDQPYAPFAERVARCAEAVARANQLTGLRCIYAPHVSADGDLLLQRARLARQAGAGALLIAPGLVGLGAMARVAADAQVGLPILSHPALQGSFVASRTSGIAHAALFGQLARLAGADATIYPNYGGRFAFSQAECRSIAERAGAPMGPLRPIFPVPAGGLRLDRVQELRAVYGSEVVFLIGGALHSYGPDLVANCRTFRQLVEAT